MTDEKLRDEIAWMKQLAEEGRNAPILGSAIGVWWGAISFIMMLVHWGALTERLPISIADIGLWWMSYAIVGSIGTALLVRKMQGKSGANSLGSRVSGAVWMLAGVGIFTFVIGCVVAAFAYGAPYWMFNVILPVAFICYGIAFGVIGLLVRNLASGITAAVSFVLALLMFPFLLGSTIYLITAFAILLVTVLPLVLQGKVKG